MEEAYTRQLEQEGKEGQMGWQETVQRGLVGEYQSIARVQAEATWRVAFKAGYAQGSLRHLGSLTQQVHEEGRKEGMGEVARWLEENNIFDECTQEIGVWWQSWQAFLKEKDIGDSNGK